MTIGTSIFLIAVGAILRYAVSDSIDGIDLYTAGLILMIAGIVGLIASLIYATIWSRPRDAVVERRTVRSDREVL